MQVPARAHAAVRSLPRGPGFGPCNSRHREAPASAFTAPQPVDLPDGNTEPGAAACAGCAACAACARAQEKGRAQRLESLSAEAHKEACGATILLGKLLAALAALLFLWWTFQLWHLQQHDAAQDLISNFLSESFRNLKDLKAGKHPETSRLAVKVLSLLKRPGEVPVIAVCCDSSGESLVLSLYNSELTKLEQVLVPGRTILAVEQANVRQISVTASSQALSYSCVAVGNPSEVTVVFGASPGSSSSLACAAGGANVFSTAAERTMEEAPSVEHSANGTALGQTREECQEILIEAAKEAGPKGGRAAVLRALVPQLRSLVEKELENGAGERLERLEAMLERMGHGEVFQEECEEGKRYVLGYVEGLEPSKSAFHNPKTYPWSCELQRHWMEIQSELQGHLEGEVWELGPYAAPNKQYAPEWKIAKIFTADHWEDRFPTTQRIIQRLSGVRPFEVFFAQMPPKTKIAEHSDNQNYILTLHLGLQLEHGKCSLHVGNRKRDWEEGQVMVFDTTFIHAAVNDSERSRYVLVLRFWHPGLSPEEQYALHLSHLLLAGTPDPEKASGQ